MERLVVLNGQYRVSPEGGAAAARAAEQGGSADEESTTLEQGQQQHVQTQSARDCGQVW